MVPMPQKDLYSFHIFIYIVSVSFEQYNYIYRIYLHCNRSKVEIKRLRKSWTSGTGTSATSLHDMCTLFPRTSGNIVHFSICFMCLLP